MAESVADARQEVVNSRQAASAELDELGASFRGAIDIPAKIRRNPVKTAGLLGGAGFLLVGGPKRVIKAVERRFFPSRQQKVRSLLPDDVADTVNRLGDDAEHVRDHLERDFRAYLEKRHPEEVPNARRSFWRTYDLLVGTLGGVALRELLRRLMEAPTDRRGEERPKG